MPPLEYWRLLLWNGLSNTLPWIVASAVVLGLLSWSPFGMGMLRMLRERRRDAAMTEELLNELSGLRQILGEVIERLDATERRLALPTPRPDASKGPRTPPSELRDPDRIVTPI